MGRYSLNPVEKADLDRIEEDWKASTENDVFESELAPLFLSYHAAYTNETGTSTENYIVGLYDSSSDEYVALVDMISRKNHTVSKLLRLTLNPSFSSPTLDEQQRKTLVEIYTEIFVQVIVMEQQRDFKEVKIYGRNDDMYGILSIVAENWDEESTQHKARMKGRWLSVSSIS